MNSGFKKAVLGLVGAAALAGSVAAQEAKGKPFIQGGSISTSWESNYTGNDYGMAFGDNPVVQTYAEAKLPKDCAIGIFSNYDSGLDRQHAFNELDVVASGKLPVEKLGIPKDYTVTLSGVHLQFPHAGFHSATTAGVCIEKKDSPLSLNIYKVWGVNSQQGYAAKLAYASDVPITEKTKFKYNLALLANSHVFTTDTDLAVVAGKIGLEHKLSDKTKMNIAVRHQVPLDRFNGTFSRRTTVSAGLSHDF